MPNAVPRRFLCEEICPVMYGTTRKGGIHLGGTACRISLAGVDRTLFDFDQATWGSDPFGAPLQASEGTIWGGKLGTGAIHAMSASGVLLHLIQMDCSLGGGSDGGQVAGFEWQTVHLYGGWLRGRNVWGRGCGGGCPAAAAVAGAGKSHPSSGTPGTEAVLSGKHFVAASAVKLNGQPASFVVNAFGVITMVVPKGANSGLVQVPAPGGIATSSLPFTVAP